MAIRQDDLAIGVKCICFNRQQIVIFGNPVLLVYHQGMRRPLVVVIAAILEQTLVLRNAVFHEIQGSVDLIEACTKGPCDTISSEIVPKALVGVAGFGD